MVGVRVVDWERGRGIGRMRMAVERYYLELKQQRQGGTLVWRAVQCSGKAKANAAGYNRSQIEPGWHAWMSYLVDKPPIEDAVLRPGQRTWELPEHRPNLTASRAAFKTYST